MGIVKKILVINTVPTERNGITNVIFNLFRSMDKDGLKIDLLCINKPAEQYIREIETAGGNVYIIPRSIRHPLRYKKALTKLIRENKYDSVHVHGNSHTLVLDLSAAKRAGCPMRIAHAHNTKCNYLILHKILSNKFNKVCTHRIACGDMAGKFMFGKQPFIIINNGVNVEKFAFNYTAREELRSKFGLTDKKVIGNVGNLIEVKNQFFLLEILKLLIQKDESFRLILVGDGPLKNAILDKANSLGINRYIILTGSIGDVENYLSAFDIFILPSLFEGVPLSLIEAQANGLYCIVSDRVSEEVNRTGNIQFVELEKGAEYWAQRTISILNFSNRKEVSEKSIKKITESEFNIVREATKLKQLYLAKFNK